MSRALLALERFLALSEAIAEAAKAQQWEDLARLSDERGACIETLPANLAVSLPAAEQAQGRMILEQCQLLDADTRSLVEERQKSLRILLREPAPLT